MLIKVILANSSWRGKIRKIAKIIVLVIQGDPASTVFENHRKSLIQHYERSEQHLHLSEQKLIKHAILVSFLKPETCDETVLPDRQF